MPVIETNNKFIKVHFLNSRNLVEYRREKVRKTGVVSVVYAQFPLRVRKNWMLQCRRRFSLRNELRNSLTDCFIVTPS